MTLCPHQLPVRVGEPFTLDQCRPCWIAAGGDPSVRVEGIKPCVPSDRDIAAASVPTPPTLRPCSERHPSHEHRPDCPMCQRWENDPELRKWWNEQREYHISQQKRLLPPPCKFRGKLIPLTERYKLNLGTLKDFYPCSKGFGENGIVCPCSGCNVFCVGYELPDDISTIED